AYTGKQTHGALIRNGDVIKGIGFGFARLYEKLENKFLIELVGPDLRCLDHPARGDRCRGLVALLQQTGDDDGGTKIWQGSHPAYYPSACPEIFLATPA